MEVYGVYMPVRNNNGERIEEIWEKVMTDVSERGTRNFIINGDFNAETEAWIQKTGKTQKEEDVIYQGVLEDMNVIACITEDHTFERGQTQIDNILVPVELIRTLREAHTAMGVREKDHKMVIASLAWETWGSEGERRPTRRYADGFQEAQWRKYEETRLNRTRDIKKKMDNKRPSDQLTILQTELTNIAAEVGGGRTQKSNGVREGEENGYDRREEQQLNKEERVRERKRHQVFKWDRLLYHARRYTGGKGKEGGHWRRREITQDYILNGVAKYDRKAKRARVIEICEEQRRKAEAQLREIRREADMTTNTDALIQSLMSLGKGEGSVVIKAFDIIKKAGGNGERVQRGIARVYQNDDNSRPIIRGPEIRQKVHKLATKINKEGRVDTKTVKEVLEWMGVGGGDTEEGKDRKEEVDRI
eukprot:5437938-Pleurochrysis_carterae.AAC.1